MKRMLMLADGKSPHTLKWVEGLKPYYDITLISFNGISEAMQKSLDQDKIFDFKVKVKVSGNNFLFLLKYFQVLKVVLRSRPQIIHAHFISSYGLMASLIKLFYFKDVTYIMSAWGSDILVTPFRNKLFFYITKVVLKRADIITSDSQTMTQKIVQIYAHKNLQTFSFGVENLFEGVLEKDELLIFSNRALTNNYNIDAIIKWFYELEDKRLKLVIANEGPLKEALKKEVALLGLSTRVEFVGFLDKIRQEEYYKQAKYYISIPSSDSTSVSLLEAMNFGCIPIVSDIDANREWITHNENGVIFRSDLHQLPRIEDHLRKNRTIIKERALWSENLRHFVTSIES